MGLPSSGFRQDQWPFAAGPGFGSVVLLLVLTERRSARFTRFDGHLGGLDLPIPSPVDSVTSPTRLERWAGCAHAHFVQDILKAAPGGEPRGRLDDHPPGQGHADPRGPRDLPGGGARPPRGRAARPSASPGPPPTATRLEEIGEECCAAVHARGLTGRPIFWQRDRRRILLDLDEFLLRRLARTGSPGARPRSPSSSASASTASRPSRCRSPTAGRSEVRGRADRLDRAEDGTLHVVDYKTGKADSYRAPERGRTRSRAARSSSSRSTAWPAATPPGSPTPRSTPSTGSPPPAAGSTAGATTSPTTCSRSVGDAGDDRRRDRARRLPSAPGRQRHLLLRGVPRVRPRRASAPSSCAPTGSASGSTRRSRSTPTWPSPSWTTRARR